MQNENENNLLSDYWQINITIGVKIDFNHQVSLNQGVEKINVKLKAFCISLKFN